MKKLIFLAICVMAMACSCTKKWPFPWGHGGGHPTPAPCPCMNQTWTVSSGTTVPNGSLCLNSAPAWQQCYQKEAAGYYNLHASGGFAASLPAVSTVYPYTILTPCNTACKYKPVADTTDLDNNTQLLLVSGQQTPAGIISWSSTVQTKPVAKIAPGTWTVGADTVKYFFSAGLTYIYNVNNSWAYQHQHQAGQDNNGGGFLWLIPR